MENDKKISLRDGRIMAKIGRVEIFHFDLVAVFFIFIKDTTG